jgi:hypothetical protein
MTVGGANRRPKILPEEAFMNTRTMLLAAGIGGVVMSIVSAVPVVSCINICCWAGIWGSGILSVFIYRSLEKTQPDLTVGQGLVLGLVAGAVAAVLMTVWGVITNLLFAGAGTAAYLDMLNQIPGATDSMPSAYRQMLEQMANTGGSLLISSFCNFVIYPFFGLIGGLSATALICKKPAVAPQ